MPGDSYEILRRVLTAARQGKVSVGEFQHERDYDYYFDNLRNPILQRHPPYIHMAKLRMLGEIEDYAPAELVEDDGSFEYAERQMLRWGELAQQRDRLSR